MFYIKSLPHIYGGGPGGDYRLMDRCGKKKNYVLKEEKSSIWKSGEKSLLHTLLETSQHFIKIINSPFGVARM